jgi:hypothetical protein
MLGNSSGNSALAGRTSVGLRGLTTVTPSTTKKIARKKGPDSDGKIDRVVREEERNPWRQELQDATEETEEQEQLTQPPGHGNALRAFDGDAFRTDAKGRTLPPAFGDVDQGNLSDSWLLASCAAVAHTQPGVLLSRIWRNEDLTFTVRLREDEIVVKAEFPHEGYADPTPNKQSNTLWVALVEKAFAQNEAGSYANLETGNPGRALEALTGNPAKRTTITETARLDTLWSKIAAAKKSHSPMVLRTRETNVAAPLHAEHAYAIVDVIERGKDRFVKVYNPWGTKGGSRPLESMLHELSLEVVRRDFEALYIGD